MTKTEEELRDLVHEIRVEYVMLINLLAEAIPGFEEDYKRAYTRLLDKRRKDPERDKVLSQVMSKLIEENSPNNQTYPCTTIPMAVNRTLLMTPKSHFYTNDIRYAVYAHKNPKESSRFFSLDDLPEALRYLADLEEDQ